MKAASVYVREQAIPGFDRISPLRSDVARCLRRVLLRLELRRQQSYRRAKPIIDFGTETVKHRYTPDQWAGAYGVPHFTYYVEFLPNADAFTAEAVKRPEHAGARPALEVRDQGRA